MEQRPGWSKEPALMLLGEEGAGTVNSQGGLGPLGQSSEPPGVAGW